MINTEGDTPEDICIACVLSEQDNQGETCKGCKSEIKWLSDKSDFNEENI